MRSLLCLAVICFLLLPFSGVSQKEKKLLSATLNIELPHGSKFETRPEKIKEYNTLFDSFATAKGYKTAPGKPEVFHTDFDSLKAVLTEKGFEMIQQDNTDFYTITKNDNKYLAFIKHDRTAFLPSYKQLSSLQLAALINRIDILCLSGVSTTILIKRIY